MANHESTNGRAIIRTLARSLSEGSEVSEESLEALFAGARRSAADAEMVLRPDDFAPEEPGSAPSLVEVPREALAITAGTPSGPAGGNGATPASVSANSARPQIGLGDEETNADGTVRQPEQLRLF